MTATGRQLPPLSALFRQGDEFHGPVHLHHGLLVAGAPGAPYRTAVGPCSIPGGHGTPWQALGRGSLSLDLADRGSDESRVVEPGEAIALLASGHRTDVAIRLLRRPPVRRSGWTLFTNVRSEEAIDAAYSLIPLPERSARTIVHTLVRENRVTSVIDLRSLGDERDRILERSCAASGISYLISLATAAHVLLGTASHS